MADANNKLTFGAEIKQVSSRTAASLDKVYKIVLETAEPSVMALGILAPDILVDVTVEPQEGGR